MHERILILAPRGRDAAVIAETLLNLGYRTQICPDLDAMTDALHENAGAAVLTEEALTQTGTETLRDWLAAQPPWSDFPFIVLVTKQPGKRAQADAARLQAIGNIVLLERPINAETLVSAAASAVRARRRQYLARDQLTDQVRAEEQLRFALEAGHLGAWELDLDGGLLTASRLSKAHFGRRPDEPLTLADVQNSVHPDDAVRRMANLDASITQGGDYEVIGENIAYQGFTTITEGRRKFVEYNTYAEMAKQMVKLWVESPPHYENVIFKKFDRSGVHVLLDNKRHGIYATQVFSNKQ